MRERKFRGKDNQGQWHYGSLVIYNDGTFAIAENDQTWTDDGYHNNEFELIKVRPETVGQYIGITDTSTPPKEIYDGDIIESKNGIRHLIKYDDDSAAFLAYKLPLNEFDNGCHIENDWVVNFEKKVIGNSQSG